MGQPADLNALFDTSVNLVNVAYTDPVCTNFDDACEALIDIIKSFNQPILCGYSMGGRLLFGVLSKKPEIIKACILVSSSPYIANPAKKNAINEEIKQRLLSQSAETFYEYWMSLPLFGSLNRSKDFRSYFNQRVKHYNPHFFIRILNVLGTMPDLRSALKLCSTPCLFIVGEKDVSYKSIASQLTEYFKNAYDITITNTSHACYLEKPEFIKQKILAFLSEQKMLY